MSRSMIECTLFIISSEWIGLFFNILTRTSEIDWTYLRGQEMYASTGIDAI